ncbi:MAG: flagellar hook-length control protein FliK [Lachnospiraceae bacterium]|nr:flagellar hook-length control protein FliK [Lachnospiraceae bacterium]
MGIAAISELALQGLMPGAVQPQKDETSGDFMQAFNNAKDGMNSQMTPIKTEGTAANGKDSEQSEAPAKDMREDKSVKTEQPRPQKTETADKPVEEKADVRTGDTRTADTQAAAPAADAPVDEATEAVLVTAMQQFIDLLAQLLDMSPEELTEALGELDISGMELLDVHAGNELAAELFAGGDISALLTDQSLAETAGRINELITETIETLKADLGDDAVQLFAPVLEAGLKAETESIPESKAPAAAESVEHMFSDAIAAPEEEVTAVADRPVQTQAKQQNEEAQEQHTEGRRENRERFDAHEFRTEQSFAPESVNVQQPDAVDVPQAAEQLHYTSNPEEILSQVAEHIRTQVTEDMSSLEMVLHPASLGSVAVRLVSQDGAVTAQFTAQNDAVRDALAGQLQLLKENMEQAGVKVEAVEVTVASHAFEQNLEQGNGGQSEAEAQEQERLRRATHRIDLGDYAEGDVIPVDEADAVTVQMMQADGNRMDYRA